MAKYPKTQNNNQILRQAMAASLQAEPPVAGGSTLRELETAETVLRAEVERLSLAQRAIDIFGANSSYIPAETRRDAQRLADVRAAISTIQVIKSKLKISGSVIVTLAGTEDA